MILAIVVFLLALALYGILKRGTYISDKEKEFILFTIDIYIQYGSELGIQSIEQHKKLCEELEKIKNKHFKIKKEDT